MKASRFNIFVNLEGSSKLLFNSDSGAIAELPPEAYEQIKGILTAPDSEQAGRDPRLVENLLYGGFLVGDGIDEIARLKVRNGQYRFGSQVFSLGICPTFECNLTCPDCSGRQSRGRMTPAVEKALLKFSQRQVKRSEVVEVTWFGGEPLLCIETIERVQRGLAEQVSKYESHLSDCGIVTNGVLLDRSMAERLKAVGVTQVQVTLDARRTAIHGQVLGNVAETESLLDITVRINVDTEETTEAERVIDNLDKRGILSGVRVYFGKTTGGLSVCSDALMGHHQDDAHIKAQIKLYHHLLKYRTMNLDFPYLVPNEQCGSASDNCYQIAPTGYLFRCPGELSPSVDDSVGNLFDEDPETFQQFNEFRYSSHDPFDSSECVQCEMLPVCMGGCPAEYRGSDNKSVNKCSPLLPHLRELLRLRYLYQKREEVST